MKDSDWRLREAAYHRLIRDAYNEGFTEGMREHTSSKGGKPWSESSAQKKMNDLARSPQDTAHE